LHSNFTWTGSSPSTILGIRKLETLGYPTVTYRKSESPNPFPMTNLRPEVELMHLVRTRVHYRRKSGRKRCRAPEWPRFY